MQPGREFPRQSFMHCAGTCDTRHSRKGGRDHMHGIMRLAPWAGAGMARVAGTVISDLKQGGLKARFQGLSHAVGALGHKVFFRVCDFFAKPLSALRLGATTPIKP